MLKQHAVIAMTDLRHRLTTCGLKDVATDKASTFKLSFAVGIKWEKKQRRQVNVARVNNNVKLIIVRRLDT